MRAAQPKSPIAAPVADTPTETPAATEPMPPLDGLLAVRPADAARMLSVTQRTVNYLVSRGQLFAVRPSHSLTLIPVWALRAFLERRPSAAAKHRAVNRRCQEAAHAAD